MTIEQIKSTPSYEPLKRNGFTDANIITYYTLTSIGERKIFFAKVKCGALNDVKIETKVIVPKVEKTSLNEVRMMAKELMGKAFTIYGKTYVMNQYGWRFSFNNNKTSYGKCKSRGKKIELSQWLLENSDKDLKAWENTMLHEIAHAIDIEIRGKSDHTYKWRDIALSIGCDGERCGKAKIEAKNSKYTLKCNTCKKERPSHKIKRRKTACGKCCDKYNGGRYSEAYVLVQIRNY